MFEKYECCMDQSISINCIFGLWPSYEKYILLMFSPPAYSSFLFYLLLNSSGRFLSFWKINYRCNAAVSRDLHFEEEQEEGE